MCFMKRMRSLLTASLVLGSFVFGTLPARAAEIGRPGYAIVVSQATHQKEDWRRVVDALVEKHRGQVLEYDREVATVLPQLQQLFPKYACFVCRPEEATREFVATAHVLMRKLDDDPYPDAFWGILTGYDAACALRIARHRDPLTIHQVASGTEVALEMCESGTWYCELKKNRMVKKDPGGSPRELSGPDDTTEALAQLLNGNQSDLFVTSGHATERDWQIGFAYRNGSFRHQNGRLFGLDSQGRKFLIESTNPKVYLPIGNCLMGHIDQPDCMALSWMNSGGVLQMLGYTVPTWFGYAGWGCLDYFVEQPGRYTFAEAFFANQIALIHRLWTAAPELAAAELDANGRPKSSAPINLNTAPGAPSRQDVSGLLFDRDVLAFYGDPAWMAWMASKTPCAWNQVLTEKDGVWTLEIRPNRSEKTFQPINRNGSQRGYRPIIQYLPARFKNIKIQSGEWLRPVVADNFILIPNPRECDPAKPCRIVFSAEPM